GVRANDLVGAIAGEANIPGSAIGKIEIRDTFSIVEVPADAGGRVISALNGTTIRNRSVRVDYDRPRGAGGPGGGAGGMRRLDRGGGDRGGGARGGGRFGGDDRGPRSGGARGPRRDGPGGGRGGPRTGGGDRGGRGGGGSRGGGFRRPRDE
ncbi:MAG TPA: DbpA RNA binding domain-containing protein, partial [Longimicrobium sp.]|nr:DbpA RNA binding domain-containing protein [Longimicrobium sp.]